MLAGAAVCLLAALPGSQATDGTPASPRVVTTGAVGAAPLGTGTTTTVGTSKTSDGRPRTFVLHVPDGLLAPAPLVVALHAHSQTTDSIRAYTASSSLPTRRASSSPVR